MELGPGFLAAVDLLREANLSWAALIVMSTGCRDR